MREVGLYALIFGVNKTVKKFGYEEEQVREWVVEAFDDPFVKVVRELVLETIKQVGKTQTSNIFKISPSTLQRFMEESNLAPKDSPPDFLSENWFISDYF